MSGVINNLLTMIIPPGCPCRQLVKTGIFQASNTLFFEKNYKKIIKNLYFFVEKFHFSIILIGWVFYRSTKTFLKVCRKDHIYELFPNRKKIFLSVPAGIHTGGARQHNKKI